MDPPGQAARDRHCGRPCSERGTFGGRARRVSFVSETPHSLPARRPPPGRPPPAAREASDEVLGQAALGGLGEHAADARVGMGDHERDLGLEEGAPRLGREREADEVYGADLAELLVRAPALEAPDDDVGADLEPYVVTGVDAEQAI